MSILAAFLHILKEGKEGNHQRILLLEPFLHKGKCQSNSRLTHDAWLAIQYATPASPLGSVLRGCAALEAASERQTTQHAHHGAPTGFRARKQNVRRPFPLFAAHCIKTHILCFIRGGRIVVVATFSIRILISEDQPR